MAELATPRELSKPPITEALVDIRAAVTAPVTAYEALTSELKGRYPNVEQRQGIWAQFKIEGGKVRTENKDMGFQGTQLRSADGNALVQFRPDGFTFNNLNAYMGGDRLITEALALWEMFAAQTHPELVSRVALRYINQLKVPLRQGDEFSRFLTAAPPTPEGAPQTVSEFLTRIVSHPDNDSALNVIVTQKFTPSDPETEPMLVLDIDAFRALDCSPDPTSLRVTLDELRRLKNLTFFAHLTDEAVESYV